MRLLPPVFVLLGFCLLMLSSVAPALLVTQAGFIAVSLVFYFLFSRIDFSILKAFHPQIFVLCLVFLLIPSLIGVSVRGSVRWIDLGPVSIQPSEIVKPFLILTWASLLALPLTRARAVLLAFSGLIPTLVVFFQPDLGSALVVGFAFVVLLGSKLSLKTVMAGIAGLVLLAYPLYELALHDYQRERIHTFIDPYSDPLGRGYHIIQSIISIGSGGLLGRGLGHGSQSQLRFLPEHHTDFIFASLSEELGFLGAGSVIIIFTWLIREIYLVSQKTKYPAESLFCLAVCGQLAFQIAVNIGMNLGLAPVTGITLPFISYGGSSLLSLFITLGIVQSISKSSQTSKITL